MHCCAQSRSWDRVSLPLAMNSALPGSVLTGTARAHADSSLSLFSWSSHQRSFDRFRPRTAELGRALEYQKKHQAAELPTPGAVVFYILFSFHLVLPNENY